MFKTTVKHEKRNSSMLIITEEKYFERSFVMESIILRTQKSSGNEYFLNEAKSGISG